MSFLKDVVIEGLRGFATKQKLACAVPNGQAGSGITFLTGPNNSGKSTIIESFRFYLWRHNRPSFHEGMRNRRNNSVRIEFQFEDRLDWIESLRKGGSETKDNFLPGRVTPYVIPSRRYFAPYFSRHPQILDRNSFLLSSGDTQTSQQRGPNLNMFEMRLFDIDRNSEKREEFNRIIKRIIPKGVNWTIDQTESSQFVLRFLGTDKAHSAEGVGEGIASLFTLVAAFYDSQPNDLIVIDEPELSLHPTFQRRLSEVISEYAATRQIILSTHSPYMIDEKAIRNGAALCRTWERDNGTEIKQIDEPARESWNALTGLNIYNPHQFGINAKEVFFLDDGIVVVEGQEDVVLLPRAFELLNVHLNAEFFGWGAGGASNIRHVCAILSSLGYLSVVALFDGDKPSEMQEVRSLYPNYFVACIPAPDVREKGPVKAKAAKRGLLESSEKVAPEFEEDARNLFTEVQSYLGPEPLKPLPLQPAPSEILTPKSSVFLTPGPGFVVGYQLPKNEK